MGQCIMQCAHNARQHMVTLHVCMCAHVQPILDVLVAKLGGGREDVSSIFQLDAAVVDRCLQTLLGGSVSRSAAAHLCACDGRMVTMVLI